MPERETVRRAKRKLKQGQSPTTAAGEFVREEMHHIREGKHGARSTKQAIAIGLSKARRAGVPLSPPARGTARTQRAAKRPAATGRHGKPRPPSRARSRAATRALRKEPHRAASHRALATHARRAAAKRGPAARSASARKAARTRARMTRRASTRRKPRARR